MRFSGHYDYFGDLFFFFIVGLTCESDICFRSACKT